MATRTALKGEHGAAARLFARLALASQLVLRLLLRLLCLLNVARSARQPRALVPGSS